jgi:hypothetical protein
MFQKYDQWDQIRNLVSVEYKIYVYVEYFSIYWNIMQSVG